MNKLMLSLVLFVSMFLSGCCSNYATYVKSMDADLQALAPVYRGYIVGDDRLSIADIKARLAIIDEMRAKTDVAKKDVE